MTLTLLESLSLAGDSAKPNEDAFGHFDGAAAVFDGATPLGSSLLPGPSDAAWIAQFGVRRLMAHLKDEETPLDALARALADTEKSFAGLARHAIKEKWQTPCASMMLAAETADGTEFLWFGDCTAIIQSAEACTIVGDAFDRKPAESARARAVAQKEKLVPAPDLNRPQILNHLRAARNRINSGRNWLFSPARQAAAHVGRAMHTLAPGTRLLIASDGFLALATDYGAYDAAGLVAAAQAKGLAALGAELRAIEDGDALGEKFARFKKSDDATALLLEVS